MKCVLVADDSRPFAEMVRATLEDAGFEVVTAYSGLAALAAGEKYDVSAAVLDVLMPGMSGDLVAYRLRQFHPGLPVLLMTGADGAYAATAGVPVLRKPFPHEELVAAVRRLLE